MKRYSKKGEALPVLDITGQIAERGSSRLDLGNGYVVLLRNHLKASERDSLIADIRKEIAKDSKKAKVGEKQDE